MSEQPRIDKRTLSFLKYIYKNDHCTIRDMLNYFKIASIYNSPEILSSLLYFLDKGYVGLLLPDNDVISTYNFQNYLAACMQKQSAMLNPDKSAMLNPDFQIFMLPEGKYIVEEITRRNRYFNIPVIISLVSAVISCASLLYQIFNNSPTLVKIIECLPR